MLAKKRGMMIVQSISREFAGAAKAMLGSRLQALADKKLLKER